MYANLTKLSVEERIRIVEELWDSIAHDQNVLPLTTDQRAELDRRLDAFKADGNLGRLASEVISDIRNRL